VSNLAYLLVDARLLLALDVVDSVVTLKLLTGRYRTVVLSPNEPPLKPSPEPLLLGTGCLFLLARLVDVDDAV